MAVSRPIALVALFIAASACAGVSAPADLVLTHGKIVTLDRRQPEVAALAVQDGRVVALGADTAIASLIGPHTRVIDLHGALATPGFIESHGHFMELGQSLTELDLTHARTWADIVSQVAAAAKAARPGAWIIGHGWHQEKWDRPPQPNVEGLPLGDRLSAVSPDNPVLLVHASGHAVFVNHKALELAGIGAHTPDPHGGAIVRDGKGRAIGMLRDNAMDAVYKVLDADKARRSPGERRAAAKRQVELAAHDALSKGITTFVDQGENFATIDFLHELAATRGLPLRLQVLVNAESVASLRAHLAQYRLEHVGRNRHLSVTGVGEILSDGALGTHSAWFLQPYTDQPGTTGLNVTPMSTIRQIADIALADHFQLAVHAIGDRANHEVLDVYAAEFKAHPQARDLRWRIEHAQHLDPADIPRFARLGVIASMQSIHACSDGPYVVKRLGQKRAREGGYVWQSLLKTGAVVANGTDVPVEDEDPIPNFHCAVTRELRDGSAFFPAQAMSRMQALRSYTEAGAYAIFEDQRLGSLAVGKQADITVFDRDLMTEPAEAIGKTRVLYTIVGGELAYQAQ